MAAVRELDGGAPPDSDQAMAARLSVFDAPTLRREFAGQGAFLYLRDFLTPEVTAQLVAAVAAVSASVNRNYLPGHKQGGSVSRHTIDRMAPSIAKLYRSPELMHFLEGLAGERLQVSPADDPHDQHQFATGRKTVFARTVGCFHRPRDPDADEPVVVD